MATKQGKGAIAEFRKKPLPKPLDYTFEYDTYSNKQAALEANVWPADADSYVLSKLNTQSEASAKSVEYQKTLKGLNAVYEKTNEYKRQQFLDNAVIGGMDLEQATAIADSVNGMKVVPGEVEKVIANYFATLGQ